MIEADECDLCVLLSVFLCTPNDTARRDDTFPGDSPEFGKSAPASLMQCDDYQFSNRVTEKKY